MNNIVSILDNVKTISFNTMYEMATWINDNVCNPIRQKQLMLQGLNSKQETNKFEKLYQITIELGNDERLMNTKLVDYDLSCRAINALFSNEIQTIRELTSLTPHKLMRMRNIGSKTREEIYSLLKSLDLKLG